MNVFVAKPRGLKGCKGLNVIHKFKDVKQGLFFNELYEQAPTTTFFEISKHPLCSENGLILHETCGFNLVVHIRHGR